jgi:hypothetical protein
VGAGGPTRRGGEDVERSGTSDSVPLPGGRPRWRAVSHLVSAINGGAFFWEWRRILLLEKMLGGVGHVALLSK